MLLYICRFSFLLEEERKARLAEGALGEAVLREVQETQTLLGEVRSAFLCSVCCVP